MRAMSTAEQLYEDAMTLSDEERTHLGERLLASVEFVISEELTALIQRRDEEMDRGEETVEWEEIRDEWRAQLNARATRQLA